MKKIYLYITCITLLMLGIASCEDNTDVSIPHSLTQEEIDEIARQDSILEAQKNYINADLVLRYTVKFLPANSWDGTTLSIELDKIAELFGISEADLLSGIAGESGAPEIKGFAINSTGVDVASATNTNGPWGHWWNKDGNVIDYGDNNIVFAEFNAGTGIFSIAQHPGRLEEGQVIVIKEGLEYNKKRVAVEITIEGLGENINGTVVSTQHLDIEIPLSVSRDETPIQFDLKKTLADLGVSSIDEVQFIGVRQDGKYTAKADESNGFSHDAKGFVSLESEDIVFYTMYGVEALDEDHIVVAQNPKNISAGDKITVQYGFLANEKIEMLNITITVTEYDDPEIVVVERDIIFSKPWTNNYDAVTEDITEALREAFHMTSFQIRRAIIKEELNAYLNEESGDTPEYTGEAPGYWINLDGTVGSWGDKGAVMCSIKHDDNGINIIGMNHPGNSKAGDVISTKMIVTCNGKKAIFNITFKLT